MRDTVLFIVVSFALLSPTVALADDDDTPKTGLFGTSFLAGWKGSAGLGLFGSRGPTDELKMIANAKGKYEDEKHRRITSSQVYLSDVDAEDSPTDLKIFVEHEENWKPFANHFFLLGLGRYDYDRLETWDHRITASLGVGSELVSTEKLIIRTSIGGGLNYVWDLNKKFRDDQNQTSPEGFVRLDGSYSIMEDLSFTTIHTYYPNLDKTSEYRVLSEAELKADVGDKGGLTLSVAVTNEYKTLAVDEKNDLTYILRIGYEF